MKVGTFDTQQRVLIVAEIGNNHEGSVERAEELVIEAARAGADAVKFQTFRTEQFVARADAERFARLERFRLTEEQFSHLARVAHKHDILFGSTPLDMASAGFLAGIADFLKIASGDNDFFPLLAAVAGTGRPMIVSTGLLDEEGLSRTARFVIDARGSSDDLALVHCVSSYPVPGDEVNLRAIGLLAERFPEFEIGYSDHTLGIDAAALSVSAGARIVEKHFTLDKNFSDFRDHQLSADPEEFGRLVDRIRAGERLGGERVKIVQASEESNVQALRRSIVAAGSFAAGHVLGGDDLAWLRPGGGMPPGDEALLLGKSLRRNVEFGERLAPEDVE
jgi:N,N'-diacetyllegionaminate synthase